MMLFYFFKTSDVNYCQSYSFNAPLSDLFLKINEDWTNKISQGCLANLPTIQSTHILLFCLDLLRVATAV